MKVAGIIAEFNPLHNGHKYIIDKMRENADCVIAVLSGNFVQRGEPAAFSKFTRAYAALCCGVDLVAELPVHWSSSYAQNFAIGGVSILKNMLADTLFFGAECDDVKLLEKIADADNQVKPQLKSGMTYAAMREKELSRILGEGVAEAVGGANNNLAIEYIKACKSLDYSPNIIPVKRVAVAHDDTTTSGEYCSASYLRANPSQLSLFVPNNVSELFENDLTNGKYTEFEAYKKAVFGHLRRIGDFSQLPEISEGIENRVLASVRNSTDYDGILQALKTKRYTLARLRRILNYAFLNIDKSFEKQEVPYINILAASSVGLKHLSRVAKADTVPIIISGKCDQALDNKAQMLLNKERTITDIYSGMLCSPEKCGLDFTTPLLKKKG